MYCTPVQYSQQLLMVPVVCFDLRRGQQFETSRSESTTHWYRIQGIYQYFPSNTRIIIIIIIITGGYQHTILNAIFAGDILIAGCGFITLANLKSTMIVRTQ